MATPTIRIRLALVLAAGAAILLGSRTSTADATLPAVTAVKAATAASVAGLPGTTDQAGAAMIIGKGGPRSGGGARSSGGGARGSGGARSSGGGSRGSAAPPSRSGGSSRSASPPSRSGGSSRSVAPPSRSGGSSRGSAIPRSSGRSAGSSSARPVAKPRSSDLIRRVDAYRRDLSDPNRNAAKSRVKVLRGSGRDDGSSRSAPGDDAPIRIVVPSTRSSDPARGSSATGVRRLGDDTSTPRLDRSRISTGSARMDRKRSDGSLVTPPSRSRTGSTSDRSNEPVRRPGMSTDVSAPRPSRPIPGGAIREPRAPDRPRGDDSIVVNNKVVNKKVVKKTVFKGGHGHDHYGWYDDHDDNWYFGLHIGGSWGFSFGYGHGYFGYANYCGYPGYGYWHRPYWGSWRYAYCGAPYWGYRPFGYCYPRYAWHGAYRYGCWPRWYYRPRYVYDVAWTVPWYARPTYVYSYDVYDYGTSYVWSDGGYGDGSYSGGTVVWDGTYDDGWSSATDAGYTELDLSPREPRFTMDDAWEMLATEQFLEAQNTFDAWIEYAPSDALPRVGRGLTAALLGADAEAVTLLREATELDPEGILLFPADSRIRRQLEDIRERFRERAAADREDHDSLFMVAFMGLLREEYGEAFYAVERLIDLGDESESALLLKALLELALEQEMWGDG